MGDSWRGRSRGNNNNNKGSTGNPRREYTVKDGAEDTQLHGGNNMNVPPSSNNVSSTTNVPASHFATPSSFNAGGGGVSMPPLNGPRIPQVPGDRALGNPPAHFQTSQPQPLKNGVYVPPPETLPVGTPKLVQNATSQPTRPNPAPIIVGQNIPISSILPPQPVKPQQAQPPAPQNPQPHPVPVPQQLPVHVPAPQPQPQPQVALPSSFHAPPPPHQPNAPLYPPVASNHTPTVSSAPVVAQNPALPTASTTTSAPNTSNPAFPYRFPYFYPAMPFMYPRPEHMPEGAFADPSLFPPFFPPHSEVATPKPQAPSPPPPPPPSTTKLNVGGRIFEVSRTLASKYPDSLFSQYITHSFSPSDEQETATGENNGSGDLNTSKQGVPLLIEKDDEGFVYLDRDPTLFEAVLMFVRSKRVHIPHGYTREALFHEGHSLGIADIASHKPTPTAGRKVEFARKTSVDLHPFSDYERRSRAVFHLAPGDRIVLERCSGPVLVKRAPWGKLESTNVLSVSADQKGPKFSAEASMDETVEFFLPDNVREVVSVSVSQVFSFLTTDEL